MKAALKYLALFLVLSASLALFAGSAIWYFLSGSPLDVRGQATKVEAGEMLDGWSHYGGDAGGNRHSTATQITPQNVTDLALAWEYSTGDLSNREPDYVYQSAAEATPILIDNKLIFCTPFNEIIAVHPGNGAELWRYDVAVTTKWPANQFVCRGVAAHTQLSEAGSDPLSNASAACAIRILMGTNDGRIAAVDASTGKACTDFGQNGIVTLNPGKDLLWPGEFQITSPPVLVGNTVIVGSSVSDNERVAAPVGTVRAFDAISGEPKWDFDPIPRDASAPTASSWQGSFPPLEGATNVWAPMSVDTERGLVFLPTSSPSPDFFGGARPGDNKHANSVVALKGETGELVWAYQIVHHDVWDYDLPAQPGLYQINTADGPVDVVAQVTKTGHVFVLDRDTGQPVLPVEERPMPQRAEAGEALSPTQPIPLLPEAIVPSELSGDDAFGITWFDRKECQRKIEAAWSEGLFSAPTQQGTLIYPFNGGGANWGSAAFDPSHNLLVVNMSNLAHLLRLIPADKGEDFYNANPDKEVGAQLGAPFAMTRSVLLSSLGLPCSPPPWGVIAGVDISSGEIVWRSTLGTARDSGIPLHLPLGTPNFGGPIVTAGGLVFIGAAMDNYIRAFDVRTGIELWKGRLSAGAQATPMSYEYEGRQYVVIYAGGHSRAGTTLGDKLVAFALPEN